MLRWPHSFSAWPLSLFFVLYIEIANLKKRYVCRFPLFLMHISLNQVILNQLIIYLAYHANFEHREIDRNQ